MFNRGFIFAAIFATTLGLSGTAQAHFDSDIDEMSDAELTEAREGIKEGLEEIREGRVEIKEELEDDHHGMIAHFALNIAEGALDTAEEVLEETLEEIEDEQESRTSNK